MGDGSRLFVLPRFLLSRKQVSPAGPGSPPNQSPFNLDRDRPRPPVIGLRSKRDI